MSPAREVKNVAASVRQRLLNLARERDLEFQRILSDYAIERLLYRLSLSEHADHFVLKGAMLFRVWSPEPHRATWDLDLLGRGVGGVDRVTDAVREMCAVAVDDGLEFVSDTVQGEEIRAFDESAGVRVRFEARLTNATIPMQIDVGRGDIVTPRPVRENYPTLLDHPAPAVFMYPREAVVAEKTEAMIALGVTNSRMKDFYDVHVLASRFAFEGAVLAHAIRATFDRRGTRLPEQTPVVLTPEFLGAPERLPQWRAFLRRGRLDAPADPAVLADSLSSFLSPVLNAAAANDPFSHHWPPGGPWAGKSEG